MMFVTPNELTVMYQLWSRLSGKGLLESCVLMKNGLPNTKFSLTCSFMKIGSCGLTNSFSRLYTLPSSSYDSILHALIYVSACCVGADIAELVPDDSSDSSLPQRTGPLDLNESLFYRGIGPSGLCHKEMVVVDWSFEMGAEA
jgi:hypothetical protein